MGYYYSGRVRKQWTSNTQRKISIKKRLKARNSIIEISTLTILVLLVAIAGYIDKGGF